MRGLSFPGKSGHMLMTDIDIAASLAVSAIPHTMIAARSAFQMERR